MLSTCDYGVHLLHFRGEGTGDGCAFCCGLRVGSDGDADGIHTGFDLIDILLLLMGQCGNALGERFALGRALDDLADLPGCGVGELGAGFHALDGLGNQFCGVLGSICALGGEVAYLIRDHGKALACGTCAGSFNGSVQRENVGLEGNILDGFDDGADAGGGFIQMIHCGDHLTHGGAVFLQQLYTADGSVVRVVGSGKAVFGLLCKEFDAVVDVVDGTGLFLCCGTEIAGNVQHFFGRAIKALGDLGHLTDGATLLLCQFLSLSHLGAYLCEQVGGFGVSFLRAAKAVDAVLQKDTNHQRCDIQTKDALDDQTQIRAYIDNVLEQAGSDENDIGENPGILNIIEVIVDAADGDVAGKQGKHTVKLTLRGG